MVQKTLNTNFQKYAGKILPNAIEAIKMRGEMERVSEYAKLFELTGNGENRWNSWNSINGLKRSLSIYIESSKGHINDSTLKSINTNVLLFIDYAESFLKTDKNKNPEAFEQAKNLMNVQLLKLSYTLKFLIDKDVENTKRTEAILGEKTRQSLVLIICVIILAITIFIFAVVITYISILKPIKSLTDTAQIGRAHV